jgi:hypothetical protein
MICWPLAVSSRVEPYIKIFSPAVISASVSVGSWSAMLSSSAGPSAGNLVTVTNDFPVIGTLVQDRDQAVAPGTDTGTDTDTDTDTDDILTGDGDGCS